MQEELWSGVPNRTAEVGASRARGQRVPLLRCAAPQRIVVRENRPVSADATLGLHPKIATCLTTLHTVSNTGLTVRFMAQSRPHAFIK